MRLAAPFRRWFVWLLILVFSTGLGSPAFAASADHGHHTAAATASHNDCHPAPAAEAWQVADLDADTPEALAEVDCALTHLGQAVLDCPASYFMTAIPCAYPPTLADRSLGQVPGLEGDPPRAVRSA